VDLGWSIIGFDAQIGSTGKCLKLETGFQFVKFSSITVA